MSGHLYYWQYVAAAILWWHFWNGLYQLALWWIVRKRRCSESIESKKNFIIFQNKKNESQCHCRCFVIAVCKYYTRINVNYSTLTTYTSLATRMLIIIYWTNTFSFIRFPKTCSSFLSFSLFLFKIVAHNRNTWR